MDFEVLPIDTLKPAAYNPRLMSEDEMRKLGKSLKAYGCVKPIIINADNTVIGGHQRLKALEAAGEETAPCVRVDLPKSQEKALNLALNKISGEWDTAKLKDVLEELDTGALQDIEITGFDEAEIEELMTQFCPPDAETIPNEKNAVVKCPACGSEFIPDRKGGEYG